VTLPVATATLGIKSTPGHVEVKIDGKPVGTTDSKGKLILDNIQVSVNHLIELEKQGFVREPIHLTVPAGYEGKKAELEQVRLSKVSTERPVDRIQQDYTINKGKTVSLERRQLLESVSEKDRRLLEEMPGGGNAWALSIYKDRHRQDKRRSVDDYLYIRQQQREMLESR
jgi:hypothetical protein